MENKDVLLATVLSALSGAVIGLLLSSDEENLSTKEKLREKGDQYLDRIKREVRDIRRDIDHYKTSAKKEAGNARDEVYTRAEEVLERAKALSSEYEEWTKEKLTERAKALNIEGCLSMSKDELIDALKNIR